MKLCLIQLALLPFCRAPSWRLRQVRSAPKLSKASCEPPATTGKSTISHHRDRRLVPIEVRPDVGAFLPAGLAHEPCLEIRQPDLIGPLVRADRDRVAAVEVLTIDQDAAHARRAHLSEGDLLRAGNGGHAAPDRTAGRFFSLRQNSRGSEVGTPHLPMVSCDLLSTSTRSLLLQ